MSRPASLMAGFQLSINGRFWVSTEVAGYDTLLGTTESYEACVAAFAGGI